MAQEINAGDIDVRGTQLHAQGNIEIGHQIFVFQAGATKADVMMAMQKFQTQLSDSMPAQFFELRNTLLNDLKAFLQTPISNELPGSVHAQAESLANTPVDSAQLIQEKAQQLKVIMQVGAKQIPYQDLKKGDLLGRGSFGEVFEASYHESPVAMKELIGDLTPDAEKSFAQELKIMMQLASPYIVQLYGVSMDKRLTLVMELMTGGRLTDLLGNADIQLSWSKRYQLALDIACGLEMLHKSNIVHRDLKSMNVLLSEREGRHRAKLADFGLSKVKSSSKSVSVSHTNVGTSAWKAPELFTLSPKHNFSSDMYAYAMVLWEIAARTIPFADADPSDIKAAIKDGERAEIPGDCPPPLKLLIERLWDQKPLNRPTAAAVIPHLRDLLLAEKEGPQDISSYELRQIPREEEAIAEEKVVEVSEADKQIFFRHIAMGVQDQAETMLRKMPELALIKGQFDDISDLRCLKKGDNFERIFQNISGWQYAIWAGDIHMCHMMKDCFAISTRPQAIIKRAKEQWVEVQEGQGAFGDSAENGHGKQFDLIPLIDALSTYLNTYSEYRYGKKYEEFKKYGYKVPGEPKTPLIVDLRKNDEGLKKYWCKVVGGLQRMLPAHVINEYCRPDRPFVVNGAPPDFLDKTLPRKTDSEVETYTISILTQAFNDGRLGDVWAFARGGDGKGLDLNVDVDMAVINIAAIDSLKTRRTLQIEQLPDELVECRLEIMSSFPSEQQKMLVADGTLQIIRRNKQSHMFGFCDGNTSEYMERLIYDEEIISILQRIPKEFNGSLSNQVLLNKLNTLYKDSIMSVYQKREEKYDESIIETEIDRRVRLCLAQRAKEQEERQKKVQTEQAEKLALAQEKAEKEKKARTKAVEQERRKTEQAQKREEQERRKSEKSGLFGNFNFFGSSKVNLAQTVVADEKDQVSEADKQTFFRYVARGEQDEAQIMLEEIPELAFSKGRFDDLSDLRCLKKGDKFGRVFQHISGWQYAVWAGDIHMCRMMKDCFAASPKPEVMIECAKAQWREVQEGLGDFAENKYGKQFDLTPLVKALNTYIIKDRSDEDFHFLKGGEYWCKEIGGLQRRLPAHVINQYCRPDCSFSFVEYWGDRREHIRDFTDLTLPRKGYMDAGLEYGLDWYLTGVAGKSPTRGEGRLGVRWAAERATQVRATYKGYAEVVVSVDARAIAILQNRRTQQIADLPNELDVSIAGAQAVAIVAQASLVEQVQEAEQNSAPIAQENQRYIPGAGLFQEQQREAALVHNQRSEVSAVGKQAFQPITGS
ncbi:MAG: serine/threonine kinase [Gammaproteobacteria bacterium]|jgi:serine/threonine protein kinase|nr:serine/threonine kinase [Gammaproteobacteria bacterium]